MDQKLEQDKLAIQIGMLEFYVKDKKVEDFSVLSFLFDLKKLIPKLKVPYLYRCMEKEYKKNSDLKEVKSYYEKASRVFLAARTFIKTSYDEGLDNLVDSINEIIVTNYDEAYFLFKIEFDI